jgi:cytochrome c-type biogenesis protein CcmE
MMVIAVAAPILALAAGLALFGLRNSISYFYTPAQARSAHVASGQAIQLGGLVTAGSVVKAPDGATRFTISDRAASARVIYRGDLPDLFREGQGVVAMGAFDGRGVFVATTILAKHDERYMPRELARALRARGDWRGDGAPAGYSQGPS